MNPLLVVLIPLMILFLLVIAFLIHMMRHLKHASHHPLYEVSEEKKDVSVSFVAPESLIPPLHDTNLKKKEASVSEAVKLRRGRSLKAKQQKVSNKKRARRAAKKPKTAPRTRKR